MKYNRHVIDEFGIQVSGPEWNSQRHIYQYRFDLGLMSVILDASEEEELPYKVSQELYPHAKHLIIEFLKNGK